MKDLSSYFFAKRKPTLVILFLSIALAGQAQWTYTATAHQSGTGCIPVPLLSGIKFYTKAACEAQRQADINMSGTGWSTWDGNCTTTVTCTPCMGSEVGSTGTTGTNGLPTPESVLIDGLLQGKAFYSSHQSREVEDWIEDYWQRMKSLGLPYEINSKLTPDDVPLTGDMKFDNLYASLMDLYSNMDPGGAVDLRNKKGTVDPTELKNTPTNTNNKPEVVQLPVSAEVWYHPEPMIKGGIPPLPESSGNGGNTGNNDHPVIDLAREASVTAVGWLPGEAGYVGIVAVNIWAEDAKGIKDIWDGKTPPSTTTMLVNAFSESAPDLANQAAGDVKEGAISKVFETASGSKGFAEMVVSVYKTNEKSKDLGGEVNGGDGDGILGKISKAAWMLGHPNSTNQ